MFYRSITFCYVFNYQRYFGTCLKMSPSILFFIRIFIDIFVLCCFLGRSRMLILLAALPSTSLTMDVFTAQNVFFFLISSSNLLSAGAAQQVSNYEKQKLFSLSIFFLWPQDKKQTNKKKEKKKRRSVFSAGCCQRANQKAPPDGEQNSCRLQINVGCNSTAICPRPRLLTAAPPPNHQNSPVLLPETPHLTASLL